jgi:hypothetical protein
VHHVASKGQELERLFDAITRIVHDDVPSILPFDLFHIERVNKRDGLRAQHVGLPCPAEERDAL